MTTDQLISLIDRLCAFGTEKDWFEFKENNSDPVKLGENLSAVANSACMASEAYGYVVFGMRNTDSEVVGTCFDPGTDKVGGQALLLWLAKMLCPEANFAHFVSDGIRGKRIVVFRVSAALGRPVTFKGQGYVRIGSSTTGLKDHPVTERIIWNSGDDWSAKVHPSATLLDLDDHATTIARKQYTEKFPAQADEIERWSDGTFLDKAKVTLQGGITNTALLLLGRSEAASLLGPAIAQITWFLKTDGNEDRDYAHFGPPFLLAVDQVLSKVRNLKVRSLPSGTLFPKERDRYDTWVLREALHNCIAHQDYLRRERIHLVEKDSRLRFENAGAFIPGSVEDMVKRDTPPSIYRNPFLARAMVNLNMIDTQGGGIRKMFLKQREHAFAMPDYDLSDPARVKLVLEGEILDEAYTQLLLDRTDLDLEVVLLLDKVQRGRRINKTEHKALKERGLVEGRYPNLHVSATLAKSTGDEVQYVRNKGLEDARCLEFILRLVNAKSTGATRTEIDDLIVPLLPAVLTPEQRKNKVHNLIQRLSREGRIRNNGSRGLSAVWLPGFDKSPNV